MGSRNSGTQQAPAGATEIPIPSGAESSIHCGTYMSPLPGLENLIVLLRLTLMGREP